MGHRGHEAAGAAWSAAAAAALLLAGTAAAVWWRTDAAGAASWAETGLPLAEADHAAAPLPLGGTAVAAIGAGGLAAALAALAVLVLLVRAGRLHWSRAAAVGLLLPGAATAGLWWGTATAPVIGANIGLGLIALILVPAAGLCAAAGAGLAWFARPGRRPAPGAG